MRAKGTEVVRVGRQTGWTSPSHSLDRQVSHLKEENDPRHLLSPYLQLGKEIGDETRAQQLEETRLQVENANKEEGARCEADDMFCGAWE